MNNIVILNSFFEMSISIREFFSNYKDDFLFMLYKGKETWLPISIEHIDYYPEKWEKSCWKDELKRIPIQNNKETIIWVAVSDSYKANEVNIENLNIDIIYLLFNYNESNHCSTVCKNEFDQIFIKCECFSDTLLTIKLVEKYVHEAQEYYEKFEYYNASVAYKKAAESCSSICLKRRCINYYAYAAIMREHTEKWREISYLWYSAYEQIDDISLEYVDYNTLFHSFPSISLDKWNSFSVGEKRGRALQYAAYSEENHSGPADSYWMFEKAATEYMKAGLLDRAIECAVSATNRYAIQFHSIKPEIITLWKELLKESGTENEDQIYHSFNEIYKRLALCDTDSSKFFYIQAKIIEQRRLFRAHKYIRFLCSIFWAWFTYFGTSVFRIIAISLIFVFLLFPASYYLSGHGSICSCIFYSADVFFNISNIVPTNHIIHVICLIETFFSYFVLVAISSHFIGRILNDYK